MRTGKREKIAGVLMSKTTIDYLRRLSSDGLWARIEALKALQDAYAKASGLYAKPLAHERVVQHWRTMELQCYAELNLRGLL